jgi:hypothetical protein
MSTDDGWADRAAAVKRNLVRFFTAAGAFVEIVALAGALVWGVETLIPMMDVALDALRSRLVDEVARR